MNLLKFYPAGKKNCRLSMAGRPILCKIEFGVYYKFSASDGTHSLFGMSCRVFHGFEHFPCFLR